MNGIADAINNQSENAERVEMNKKQGFGPLKPNTIICGIHKNDDLDNLTCVIKKYNNSYVIMRFN